MPILVPNPNVGPQALRYLNQGRLPLPSSVAAPPSLQPYDYSAISALQSGLASGSPFTWTQPASAGACAIVAIFGYSNNMDLAASAVVTFGGQALNSLGAIYNGNGTVADGWIWVFALNHIIGGASQTVSVTLTETGKSFFGFGTSFTYLNVAAVGPLITNFSTSSNTGTITVPSALNNTVWGAMADIFSHPFSGPNFNERQQSVNINSAVFIAGDIASGAVSGTLSASSAGSTWGAVGLNLGAPVPQAGYPPAPQIPNPYVGPQALRVSKRMPYVGAPSSTQQNLADGANQTITFTTSDDGFVQPGGLMPPLRIPNPFVGPQALRNQKRMPYVAAQQQGYTDGANQSIVFGTSDDGFVDHKGAQTAVLIPNPFVGPQALRNRKRMPYVPAVNAYQRLADGANSTWTFTTSTDGFRGISDGANQTITFTTSDDGFVDHKGARTSVVIANPFVGPMALRNTKRMPYVSSQRQGYADGANQTITFTTSTDGVRGVRDGANVTITFSTSDDGFVDHKGAKTSVVIANPFVGPQALRQSKRMPYVSSQRQGYADGANLDFAMGGGSEAPFNFPFILPSASGFVDTPHYIPIQIPNPFVGPMAMRNRKRMPYQTYSTAAGPQSLFDGANSTWVFTTSTNGKLSIKDGANSTWTFTTSTDGHRGITDGANVTVTWTLTDDGFVDHKGARTSVVIPTPFVGPQALRHSKRMPYQTYRSASFADAANTTIVFTTSTDGHRGIKDGANQTITFSFATAGQRHILDGANQTITFHLSSSGIRAIRDVANLNVAFTTSTDGSVQPFLVDVEGTVVVGPHEIRSVTLSQDIWTVIVNAASSPFGVAPDAFTVTVDEINFPFEV